VHKSQPLSTASSFEADGVRSPSVMDLGTPEAEEIVIATRNYTSAVKDEALPGDEEVGSLIPNYNLAT
jgi:hypothetical protein